MLRFDVGGTVLLVFLGFYSDEYGNVMPWFISEVEITYDSNTTTRTLLPIRFLLYSQC